MTEQQEIDYDLMLFHEEREWRKSLPRLEEAQWLNIFPQAKKQYGKYIKGKLKIEKKYLTLKKEDIKQKAIDEIRNNKAGSWRDLLISERLELDLERIRKRCRTIDALIELVTRTGRGEAVKEGTVSKEQIERARAFPLKEIVEVNKQGFAKCVWHDDSHASMFCRNNFGHCFSCQHSGDTIAVLMQKDKISFKQAVLQLQ